ncbi:MAG: hypothetical protein LBK24_01935 [Puniceicoccales bacterium]|jgi:hypothetical protein|nr:hypothetical protein [Puniceicoccales bacterium]
MISTAEHRVDCSRPDAPPKHFRSIAQGSNFAAAKREKLNSSTPAILFMFLCFWNISSGTILSFPSKGKKKNHDDSTTAAAGAQHVSAVNHNYLTTILGLNIEREPLDSEHVDKRWLFSLKLGWEYQVMRKHTDATILIDNPFGIGKIIPAYGQPGKHAAVGVLSASKKLNDNWNIVGAYMGRFNRRISAHSLACGIQYFF